MNPLLYAGILRLGSSLGEQRMGVTDNDGILANMHRGDETMRPSQAVLSCRPRDVGRDACREPKQPQGIIRLETSKIPVFLYAQADRIQCVKGGVPDALDAFYKKLSSKT